MTSYSVTIFGIHLKLKPIAFTLPVLGGWDIYWYGIIIAVGFMAALLYAYKYAKLHNIDTDRMIDVVLVTTPLAILCARAYYVIFDGEKLSGIKDFFGFGTSSGFSGLAIYGGVIGALLFGGIMCKLRKINILDMFDLTMTCFLLAQGIGRWGNFMNQEAYGSFTGSNFWGMQSDRTISEMGLGMVHPCFLYESVWCIAGFFILHFLSKRKKYSGQILLFYGVWYGFGRAIIELLRTDSLMIGSIKVSCLLSAAACIGCAVILFINYKKTKPVKEKTYDYQNVFETEDKKEEKEGNENEQTD